MRGDSRESHRVESRRRDGVALVALVSPEAGTTLEVAPAAGGAAVSFRSPAGEHLHLPEPLGAFVGHRRTGGIPLLHPYANRLRGTRWSFRGRIVDPDASPCRHVDANGLPMHGELLRWSSWKVATAADAESATLDLGLDWADHSDLMAGFPFPHRLDLRYRLAGPVLEVRATVTPTETAMPASFGWHPYLRVPEATRDDLSLTLPSLERIEMDERGLPVRAEGRLVGTPMPNRRVALADAAFDDLHRLVGRGSITLAGGGRGIRLEPGDHCRFLQIYSPPGADFAAVEPMTAPTAALDDGGDDLPVVEVGESFTASFSVRVLGSA